MKSARDGVCALFLAAALIAAAGCNRPNEQDPDASTPPDMTGSSDYLGGPSGAFPPAPILPPRLPGAPSGNASADSPPDPAASNDMLPEAYGQAQRKINGKLASDGLPIPRPPEPVPQGELRPAKDSPAPATGFTPFFSVPLEQLLGPNGMGSQMVTALKIRAADGTVYSASAQPSRLGGLDTGYLILYRPGMRAPSMTDLRGINIHGVAGMFAGGPVKTIQAEGRLFDVGISADWSDNPCSKEPKSVIELSAAGLGDKEHSLRMSISEAFAATSDASLHFDIPATGSHGPARGEIAAYPDYPPGSGYSVNLSLDGPGGGSQQQVPVEWLTRPDGRLLFATLQGRRIALRMKDRTLEVYDLSAAPKGFPGAVDIASLAPPKNCK